MNCRLFVLAAALVCAACRTAPPPTSSREPRFAIELPGPVRHHPLVFDHGGTSSQIPFSSLTEISVRAQTSDGPVTLQLDYSAEAGRARIVSYAVYPTGKKRLGDHRARLNESVKLTELQTLGYLPFTIRVLPPKPPARPNPAVSSDAPSIHIEVVAQDWDFFTLRLHNLSPHAVVSTAVGQLKTACDGGYATTGGIPAGGTITVTDSGAKPVVVRCALFDDGSWEGDPAIIAAMKARQAAIKALRRQINEVAARVLSDTSLDDAARIARIRSGIDALPDKPAPALIRQALAGLPVHRLGDAEQHGLEYDLHGLKWIEGARLGQFDPTRGKPLAQFWAATHRSQ